MKKTCPTCDGDGAVECDCCGGTGSHGVFGDCERCDGLGKHSCPNCGGCGEVECD
jgi:hypothetical protein